MQQLAYAIVRPVTAHACLDGHYYEERPGGTPPRSIVEVDGRHWVCQTVYGNALIDLAQNRAREIGGIAVPVTVGPLYWPDADTLRAAIAAAIPQSASPL